MYLNLENRTVLITGASMKVAKGVALSMAAQGCNLHLVADNIKELESTALEITDKYAVEVYLHNADLGDNSCISELLESAGVPDILINTVEAIASSTLVGIGETDWLEAWELKVISYIDMCRIFYTAMKACGYGVIINVTGLAVNSTVADYISSTAGNAGLNTFTRKWGSRSLKDGIRVLSVSAGVVETERLAALMQTRAVAKFVTPDQWQSYLKKLTIGRAGAVEDYVKVVTLIASDRTTCMSGTVVAGLW